MQEVSDSSLLPFAAPFGAPKVGGIKDLPGAEISSPSVDPSKMIAGSRFDFLWKVWNEYGVPTPLWSGPLAICQKCF